MLDSANSMSEREDFYDVIVIGYGPVGMATAALLGQMGHRVGVFERHRGLYNLPRAATFDHEIMRILQKLGCAEDVLAGTQPWTTYEWCNGAGELLIEHVMSSTSKSGWAESYLMYQPRLEDILNGAVRQLPAVEVSHGWRAVDLRQQPDRVEVTAEEVGSRRRRTASARYVVACDGGNSFVRDVLGIGCSDYGFQERWLVTDFRIRRPLPHLPQARQLCDPAQPGVLIGLGPEHRRWSFMILPGESEEEAVQPANVWRRIQRWATPDDLELIRSVNYTFRSLVADRWRSGRVFLAGDAAHQMPPFLGQGMCCGIRDALNLAWKLDLVLKAKAGDQLLSSYMPERAPHVQAITMKAIELGKIQTMRDVDAAERRDAALIAKRLALDAHGAPEHLEYPGLEEGVIGSDLPAAGELFIQGRVRRGHGTGLFDDVVGGGFTLLARGAASFRSLSPADRDFWQQLGGVVAGFGPDGLQDVDGRYEGWFDEHDCAAVIVRPDFYVYAGLRSWTDLPPAMNQLRAALTR